jgi:lactate dehydrogenase-like 2-hydroxyacid dehydrogenase
VEVLFVASSAEPGARPLVDRAVIEALGPEGALVNVARGSLVDEAELATALTDGRLGGAALDVFAHEPDVPKALRSASNVVLTPHTGSATLETRSAMADLGARQPRRLPRGRAAADSDRLSRLRTRAERSPWLLVCG